MLAGLIIQGAKDRLRGDMLSDVEEGIGDSKRALKTLPTAPSLLRDLLQGEKPLADSPLGERL